jgi:predicted oxidoreductase
VSALLRIGAQAEANHGIALTAAILGDHLSIVTALLMFPPQAFVDPGNGPLLAHALKVAARQTGVNQPAITKLLNEARRAHGMA